jgi:hypothetical protein
MCGCEEDVATRTGEVEFGVVQTAGWFIGGQNQGGDGKNACECLAVGGADIRG